MDASISQPDAEPLPVDEKLIVQGTAELRALTSGGVLAEPLEDGDELQMFLEEDWQEVQVEWSDGAHFRAELEAGATYYLRYKNDWLVSSRPNVDLSRFVLGRSDAEPCNRASTLLQVDAQMLGAWKTGDELQLVSANTGAMIFNLETYVSGAPRSGDAELSMSVRWYETGEALINGSMGDQAILTQLTEKTSNGRTYRAATRALIAPAFRMLDGETTAIRGSFTTPVLLERISVRVDPMKRRDFGEDLNPAAVSAGSTLYIDAMPFGGEHGQIGATPDLMILPIGAEENAVFDVELELASVYPSSWKLFGQMIDNFWVSILADDATEPLDVLVSVLSNNDYEELKLGNTMLQVGPVQEIRIEERPGFARNRIATATPKISWMAPKVGTANQYGVTIYRVYAEDGKTAMMRRAGFVLEGTEMSVPPNILEPGETYVFLISAHDQQDTSAIERPYASRFPEAYAESLTGLVTIAN